MSAPESARKRWTLLGHDVVQIGVREFEVRELSGVLIGWITPLGEHYRAHGLAQGIREAPVLGTFRSGLAALTVVAGNYQMIKLRERTLKEAQAIERAEKSKAKRAVTQTNGSMARS